MSGIGLCLRDTVKEFTQSHILCSTIIAYLQVQMQITIVLITNTIQVYTNNQDYYNTQGMPSVTVWCEEGLTKLTLSKVLVKEEKGKYLPKQKQEIIS